MPGDACLGLGLGSDDATVAVGREMGWEASVVSLPLGNIVSSFAILLVNVNGGERFFSSMLSHAPWKCSFRILTWLPIPPRKEQQFCQAGRQSLSSRSVRFPCSRANPVLDLEREVMLLATR